MKPGKRPDVTQYLITEFAFPIDDGDRARSAAHANVKAFLKQQPKKDEPPTRGAKLWPHFKKVIGDDKASRELFVQIVSDPKNLELLEKATETPASAGKLYQSRREELYKAAHIPDRPGLDFVSSTPRLRMRWRGCISALSPVRRVPWISRIPSTSSPPCHRQRRLAMSGETR